MKKSQKILYIGADGEQPEHLCAPGGSVNRDHSRTLAISTQAECRPLSRSNSTPRYLCTCLKDTWLGGKESACQRRRGERPGFHPQVGKISRRRKWQHTPVFRPWKSHGQRSLVGYSPWGRKRVGQDLATKQQLKGHTAQHLLQPHS